MKRLTLLLTAAILLFFCASSLAGTLESFSGEKGEIRIAGGTAHIPVMKEAAARIMAAHPDIHVTIAGGGSGVGIKQVGEGLIDIGNSGRKPTEDEVKQFGLSMYQWAIDGVAIVVHPSNPVRALEQKQLAAIFAGTITNWREVGGPDQRINLYTRDESSGTREVFWKKALNKGAIAAGANFVVSNGAMKGAVSQDPHAIGYISVGHVDDSVAPVAFNGVAPTLDEVKSGHYTVARGLYSNTKGEASGLVKKFLDYLLTPEGQALVAENGFVPVK